MKTVKITVLAILAIGFLTGLSQLNEEKGIVIRKNQKINQPKVKLLAFGGGITKRKTPTMN